MNILYYIISYYIVIVLCFIVILYCIILCYIILYYVKLHSILFYYMIWYYLILYDIIWHYIIFILYYMIWYLMIWHDIILYHIILYYTVYIYISFQFQCPKLVRISTSSFTRSECCGAEASLMSMTWIHTTTTPIMGQTSTKSTNNMWSLGDRNPILTGFGWIWGFTSDGFGVMHRWHGIVGIVILEWNYPPHAVLVHLWSLSWDLSSFRLELASLMVLSLIFLKILKVLAERIRFKKNDLKNYGFFFKWKPHQPSSTPPRSPKKNAFFFMAVQPRKPVTLKAGGMSYALMKHPEGLPCDVFISHAWAEGTMDDWGTPMTLDAKRWSYTLILSNIYNIYNI